MYLLMTSCDPVVTSCDPVVTSCDLFVTSCDISRGLMLKKIKSFTYQKVTLPPGRHKIIILDEADRLD